MIGGGLELLCSRPMKRAVAELLRHRTPWQLLIIAAVCTILALWIIYTSYGSTLKQLKGLLVLLFGIGGAALFMAIFRRAENIEKQGAAAPRMMPFLAGIVGLAGLIAFVTYSFGHHRRDMVAGCNAVIFMPDTLPGRQEALARAQATLRSPFAWLPALLDDEAARECERIRLDLARVEQGLCTENPLVDRDCICGAERYPYARCKQPRCLYQPGLPDRFDCPGDPITEGSGNF